MYIRIILFLLATITHNTIIPLIKYTTGNNTGRWSVIYKSLLNALLYLLISSNFSLCTFPATDHSVFQAAFQPHFKLMKTKCCANGILAQNLPIKNTSDMQTLKIVSGQVRSVELVGECETLIVECNSVSQY